MTPPGPALRIQASMPLVDGPPRSARSLASELLSCRRVRAFLGLQALGQLADAMTTLVLAQVVVVDLQRGASASAIGLTLLVATMPWLVAGPLAGVATDRLDRRTVLSVSAGARAVLALVAATVPASGNLAFGYAVAAMLLGCGAASFVVRGASWPHLVAPDRLVVMNSLSSIAGKIAGSCGFVVAAVIGTSRPLAVLTVASVCHVLGSVGYLAGRTPLGGGVRRPPQASWRVSLRHLHHLARRQPARSAIAEAVTQRAIFGAAFVTFVLLADQRYTLDASGYAAAIGLTATGAFAGTLVTPVVAQRCPARHLVTITFAASSVAMAVAGAWPSSAVVVAAMVVASCSFQIVRLTTDATVQRQIEDQSLGRVFAGFDAVYNAAYLVGAGFVVAVHADDPVRHLPFLSVAYAAAVAIRVPPSIRRRSRSS